MTNPIQAAAQIVAQLPTAPVEGDPKHPSGHALIKQALDKLTGPAAVGPYSIAPGSVSFDALSDDARAKLIAAAVAAINGPPPSGITVIDLFDRTGTNLGSADQGGTWALEQGAWATNGAVAYATTSPAVASLGNGTRNGRVTAEIKMPTTNGFREIRGRMAGPNSGISLSVSGSDKTATISTIIAGTATTKAGPVAIPSPPAAGAAITLTLDLTDKVVTGYINGVALAGLTFTLTDTEDDALQATRHGIRSNGGNNDPAYGFNSYSYTPAPVAPGGGSPTDPGAITQPPLGDEPGWTQVIRNGFDTEFARGGFRAANPTMLTIENVRGTNGTAYYRDSTAYGAGSELIIDLGWYDGTDGGLAEYRGFELLPSRYRTQLYGRFDMRIWMPEELSGWKGVSLWYDNNGVWRRGEVDPWETGSIGGGFKFYTHVVGDPEVNAFANESVKYPGTTDPVSMKARYITISGRWTPTEISVWVDGQKATATTNQRGFPQIPMRLAVQFEWSSLNASVPPNNQGRAKLRIDWFNVYDYNPNTMPVTAAVPLQQLTVGTGGVFKAGPATIRLAGANFYDAITSDAGTSPGNLQATPGTVRRLTLDQLFATRHNAIRAHTLFVGYGKAGTQMPTNGVYDEAVLVRCDEFLAECRARGMYVMAPLTDSWDFYHGGAITFANMVLGGTRSADQARTEFCVNPTVIAAFRAYITTLMNRTNTVTGIKWKDDTTLAILETANEAWQTAFMTGAPNYHASLAAWLHTNFPTKLIADGFACSGSGATIPAHSLGNPDFQVVGTHFYDDMRNNTGFLATQAARATAAGQAFVLGEWDWRDVQDNGPTIQNSGTTRQAFLTAMDGNTNVNGSFWWAPRVTGRNNNGAYQLYLDSPATPDQTSARAQLTTFDSNFKTTKPEPTQADPNRRTPL